MRHPLRMPFRASNTMSSRPRSDGWHFITTCDAFTSIQFSLRVIELAMHPDPSVKRDDTPDQAAISLEPPWRTRALIWYVLCLRFEANEEMHSCKNMKARRHSFLLFGSVSNRFACLLKRTMNRNIFQHTISVRKRRRSAKSTTCLCSCALLLGRVSKSR